MGNTFKVWIRPFQALAQIVKFQFSFQVAYVRKRPLFSAGPMRSFSNRQQNVWPLQPFGGLNSFHLPTIRHFTLTA